MTPYERIIAAAEWTEANHTPDAFVCGGPELRAVAARVASGDLDVSDMPEPGPGDGPWSPIMIYLEDVRGIPITMAAHARCGTEPALRVVSFCVEGAST